jgi:hypothetical protein
MVPVLYLHEILVSRYSNCQGRKRKGLTNEMRSDKKAKKSIKKRGYVDRDKRIKILAEHLIWAINQAYVDSDLIQEALTRIEEEGYQVDILLASCTRFGFDGPEDEDEEVHSSQSLSFLSSSNEEDEENEEDLQLSAEINEFDRTFLKLIKVGYL